ncbi:MAG TPA: IPT/TIG domain-containing protein [Verrucomicrobiae bacterium]|jgi:hypothetical protein
MNLLPIPNVKKSRYLANIFAITMLVLAGTALQANAQSVWNGGGGDINWSTPGNWTPGGVPGSATNVSFDNLASVSDGTINNTVDAGFVGPIASLNYTNTANGSYENTSIASGVTLVVNGPFNVGSSTMANTAGNSTTVTISGAGGALSVTNNANTYIGWTSATGDTGPAYLDMSGLDNFDAFTSRLIIGQGNSGSLSFASGIVYLAKTNIITAGSTGTGNSSTIVVGDNNSNSGYPSYLYLGIKNIINAVNIGCGLRKQTYTGYPYIGSGIMFNPAFTSQNPFVSFRGSNGVSAVSNWTIGDGVAASSTVQNWGSCDFTGGTVDALVNTMALARPAPGESHGFTSIGSLTLSAGIFSVNTFSNAMLTSSTGPQIATGTINVNGTGILSVNNLIMGALNGFTGSALGTLNVTNGTVEAGTIVSGGGTNTINLDDGTLIVTNTVGTPALPITALNLTGGTLQLNISGHATNIVANAITTSGTTTVNIASIANVGTGTVTVPIIYYNGADPAAGLSLGTVPSGCASPSLVDDTAHQTIDLTITVAASGPSITNLSPACGLTNGGTLVTINGANFVGGLTVTFGATSASSVNFSNSTLITAVAPAGAVGAVNVTVQNPDTQTAAAVNGFVYITTPSILPATVSGTNLDIQFASATGVTYYLEDATNLTPPVSWAILQSTNATGGAVQLQAPIGGFPGEFFRVSAGTP